MTTVLAASPASTTRWAPAKPGSGARRPSRFASVKEHALPGFAPILVAAQEFDSLGPKSQARAQKGPHADDWASSGRWVYDNALLPAPDQTIDEDQEIWRATATDVVPDIDLAVALSDLEEVVDEEQDADLTAALSELERVVDEAREDGLEPPSREALQNADRLVRSIFALHPCRFEVYPTEDAEVALSVPGGHRRSVLLLCDSNGGALCSVNLNGQHRRAVYDSAEILPDGFVREALAELRK